jgi:hypothetical protein
MISETLNRARVSTIMGYRWSGHHPYLRSFENGHEPTFLSDGIDWCLVSWHRHLDAIDHGALPDSLAQPYPGRMPTGTGQHWSTVL